MSSDLLDRLRRYSSLEMFNVHLEAKDTMAEAAKRIEELEAQIRKMRSYLEPSRDDLQLLCEKADSKFTSRDAMGQLVTQQIVSRTLQAYGEVTELTDQQGGDK